MSNLRLLLFCLFASVVFCDLIEREHPTGGTLPPGHPPIPGGDTDSDSSGKKSTMPDYMKYFYIMFYVIVAMFIMLIMTLIANLIMMFYISMIQKKLELLTEVKQKL